MEVTIKSLRTFPGLEGNGYACAVLLDGIPSFKAMDPADGGPLLYEPIKNTKASAAVMKAAVISLKKYALTLPEVSIPGCNMAIQPDDEVLIGDAVQAYHEEQQLRRWCKTAIILKMPDAPAGQYEKVHMSPILLLNTVFRPRLLVQFPGAEIVNDRFTKKEG